METNKPKEIFQEDTKAAELAAKNTYSTIMDNYYNYLTDVTCLYTNFFTNVAKLFPQPFHLDRNNFQNYEPLAASMTNWERKNKFMEDRY